MPKDKSKTKKVAMEIKELKNKLKKVKKSKVKKSKPKSTKGLTKKQMIELKLKQYMDNLLPKGGGGGGFEQKPVEVAKSLPNASTSSVLHSNLLQSDKADAIREMNNQLSNLKKDISEKKEGLTQIDYQNLLGMHGNLYNNIDRRISSNGVLTSSKLDLADINNKENANNILMALSGPRIEEVEDNDSLSKSLPISNKKGKKSNTYSPFIDDNPRVDTRPNLDFTTLRDYQPQKFMPRFYKTNDNTPQVVDNNTQQHATASLSESVNDSALSHNLF
jgi:hypothetical protein